MHKNINHTVNVLLKYDMCWPTLLHSFIISTKLSVKHEHNYLESHHDVHYLHRHTYKNLYTCRFSPEHNEHVTYIVTVEHSFINFFIHKLNWQMYDIIHTSVPSLVVDRWLEAQISVGQTDQNQMVDAQQSLAAVVFQVAVPMVDRKLFVRFTTHTQSVLCDSAPISVISHRVKH